MTDWRDEAACVGEDPELFFPKKGDSRSSYQAKEICDTCKVTEPCLTTALADPQSAGVWGGLGPQERRRLRESRRGGMGVHDVNWERRAGRAVRLAAVGTPILKIAELIGVTERTVHRDLARIGRDS